MKPATFICNTEQELSKPLSYAKRLLEVAKFGIIIRVAEKKLKRTSPQNRYYWGVVLEQLSEATGHTPLELHEILKVRHLKVGEKEFNGVIYEVYKSTTDLNTAEFEEYLEKCRRDGTELGIVILLPNETEFEY